jgi:hypothetical protein
MIVKPRLCTRKVCFLCGLLPLLGCGRTGLLGGRRAGADGAGALAGTRAEDSSHAAGGIVFTTTSSAGGLTTGGGGAAGGTPSSSMSTMVGGGKSTGGATATGGAPDAGVAGSTGKGSTSGIRVVAATYGPICGVAPGNVTAAVAQKCNGIESTCNIFVNYSTMGDPAYLCAKDFEVIWVCGSDPTEKRSYHEPVGDESYVVSIGCQNSSNGGSDGAPPPDGAKDARRRACSGPASGICITSATYGPICGVAEGNVTALVARQCEGVRSSCTIHVSNSALGDPAYRCTKDFEVTWACGADATERTAYHLPVGDENYDVLIACP